MDKFIDRQKLEAHFSPAITGKDAYTAGEVLLSIQKFPSADVVPVVHAHWLESKTFEAHRIMLMCSYCTSVFNMDKPKKIMYRYCPHCSAKMDEEVKTDE